MNIGKYEVSTPTFIFGAILLALLIAVPSLLMSRMGAIRESMRTDAILNAESIGAEALPDGIAACREMIAADPKKIAARLHLGCLLAVSKNYEDARKEFDAVQDWANATAEEKSLALVGAASSICLAGGTDGKPKNLAEAERTLQKAIEFKETPDALAAMALVQSWKADGKSSELDALVKKALAAEPAPTAALLAELYKLNGTILARKQKPYDAANAYGSVKAITPKNTAMDDSARLTTLAGLTEPSLSSATRREMIAKIMKEIDKFGSARNEALLAIGAAWHLLKGDPDYYDKGNAFDKALETFKLVIAMNARDARAYRCQAALLEERIDSFVADVSIPISGLKGESVPQSAWEILCKRPLNPNAQSQPITTPIAEADQVKVKAIYGLLRDENYIWENLLNQQGLDKSDRRNALLRQISCSRRRVLATPYFKTLRRDESLNLIPDPEDTEILKRAATSGTELSVLDESGRGAYTLGLVQIERGEFAAARNAFADAIKRGYKSEELTKLFAQLNQKPRLVSAGPSVTERQFGNAPLIRASFESPLGLSALKLVKVSLNGKDIPATASGSEILYLPRATEIGGGEQKIRFTASDASGAPIEFPEFSYSVDKDPPTWNVAPNPNDGPVKPDVVFDISAADPSGMNWQTLTMSIVAVKTDAAAPLNVVLIRDGRYTHGVLSAKIKSGERIERSPFKLAPISPLLPGDYKMSIEVSDQAGNKLKDEKKFGVK